MPGWCEHAALYLALAEEEDVQARGRAPGWHAIAAVAGGLALAGCGGASEAALPAGFDDGGEQEPEGAQADTTTTLDGLTDTTTFDTADPGTSITTTLPGETSSATATTIADPQGPGPDDPRLPDGTTDASAATDGLPDGTTGGGMTDGTDGMTGGTPTIDGTDGITGRTGASGPTGPTGAGA